MLDEKTIIERIRAMPIEEIDRIMRKTLEESGIPFTVGSGKIIFDGFPAEFYHNNTRKER